MCNICGRKIGNRYADQTPSQFRPVIDAARSACNPRKADDSIEIIGGMAGSKTKQRSFIDEIPTRSVTIASDQRGLTESIVAQLPQVVVFAFETRDDRWLNQAVFEALRQKSPDALILRIMHRDGGIQFWSLDEVMSHFSLVAVAA